MRSAKDLRGIAIVDVKNGRKLGHADEIVVSPDDGRLLGFVMREGNFLNRSECAVEIDDVRSIGTDAITVEGDEVARDAEALSDAFREARSGKRRLVGRQVVTQDGTLVGTISDIVLDVESRRLAALTIGGGIFEQGDAIPADRLVSVGDDVVVVRDPGNREAGSRDPTASGGVPATSGPTAATTSREEQDIRP